MSTAQINVLVTPAELLAMPESQSVELVQGTLVEKPVSVLSSLVESKVVRILDSYCDAHRLGVVLTGSNGIRCFRDEPNKVRKPDVSFIKAARFSLEHLQEGFLSLAPDLVGEVISTYDEASEINEKVEEYLEAGIPLVWVIDPETQIVLIHRADGSVTKLRKTDVLTGENVVPGFQCRVAELFPSLE